jgi:hypothetical protein
VGGLTQPTKVAVSFTGSEDASGPHLFWSDPVEGALYRAGLDGASPAAIVTGVKGIAGVAATYEYVYYTVPSAQAVFRVAFGCGGEGEAACAPELVADADAPLCDGPNDVTYSPQALLPPLLPHAHTSPSFFFAF